jgi:hypothetical protein
LAYDVAQRTRELGLRLALGATSANLRAMVLKQIGLMALVGGVIGLATAISLGRAAEALLFGVTGYDPLVLIAATTVRSAVVLCASYLPARRASTIAPMEALRYEKLMAPWAPRQRRRISGPFSLLVWSMKAYVDWPSWPRATRPPRAFKRDYGAEAPPIRPLGLGNHGLSDVVVLGGRHFDSAEMQQLD